ncbi:hypothetical protein CULT_1880005 [[Clostridium] ultunense Esp]|nr:hypothetical protein CULT_1880005 [[Clostridium] ultunense Esp]
MITMYRWPDVLLSRKEIRMLKLKAALYANNNVVKLLAMAIEKYKEELPEEKCLCGGKAKIAFASETYNYQIADETVSVNVNNIPVFECQKCGKTFENLYLMAAIEKIVDEEVELSIKGRRSIPNEINFEMLASGNWGCEFLNPDFSDEGIEAESKKTRKEIREATDSLDWPKELYVDPEIRKEAEGCWEEAGKGKSLSSEEIERTIKEVRREIRKEKS